MAAYSIQQYAMHKNNLSQNRSAKDDDVEQRIQSTGKTRSDFGGRTTQLSEHQEGTGWLARLGVMCGNTFGSVLGGRSQKVEITPVDPRLLENVLNVQSKSTATDNEMVVIIDLLKNNEYNARALNKNQLDDIINLLKAHTTGQRATELSLFNTMIPPLVDAEAMLNKDGLCALAKGMSAKTLAIMSIVPIIAGSLLSVSGFAAPEALNLFGRNTTNIVAPPDGKYHFVIGAAPDKNTLISSFFTAGLLASCLATTSAISTVTLRSAISMGAELKTQAVITMISIWAKTAFSFQATALAAIDRKVMPLAYMIGGASVVSELSNALISAKLLGRLADDSTSKLKTYLMSNLPPAIIQGIISFALCLTTSSTSAFAAPVLGIEGAARFMIPYVNGAIERKLFSICCHSDSSASDNESSRPTRRHQPTDAEDALLKQLISLRADKLAKESDEVMTTTIQLVDDSEV